MRGGRSSPTSDLMPRERQHKILEPSWTAALSAFLTGTKRESNDCFQGLTVAHPTGATRAAALR